MLPTAHFKPTENSQATNQNKPFLQSTKLQMNQNKTPNQTNSETSETELKLDQEFMNFISIKPKEPPTSEVSTDTLRLLGAFDTKPIVSCVAENSESECFNKKVTFDNFKLKCSTLLDYIHPKKNVSSLSTAEPNVNNLNLENNIEEDADSRMIKMYFSHLEDKADSSSSSSGNSGNSNSEDNSDENSNDDDGTSSYSQSTSSRNAESIISSTGSGPHPNLPGTLNRPLSGQHPKTTNKTKKRNQRKFHDYFNANKHEPPMYNLIRHTFTGPNDLEYLRQPKTKQTLKTLFEGSRNCIKKITPENEQVETGKVLLISQHTIKQVKKMNVRPTNSKLQNIPFYKYLHKNGLHNIRNSCSNAEKLFVASEDGPFARVFCKQGFSSSSNQQNLQTINEFDHLYISDVTSATLDNFVAATTYGRFNLDPAQSECFDLFENNLTSEKNDNLKTEIITDTKFIEKSLVTLPNVQLNGRKNLDFMMLGANAFTAQQVAKSKIVEEGEQNLSQAKRIAKLLQDNPDDWWNPVMRMCRLSTLKGRFANPPPKKPLSMTRRSLDRGMADLSQRIRMMNVIAEYNEDIMQFDFAGKPEDERLSHLIQYCMKISKKKEINFHFAVYLVAESYLMTFTHGQLLEGVEKYKKILDALDLRRSVCI